MDPRGKVVIVTGASSGIGRATALEFAGAGARVALGARREDRLREVVEQIEGEGGEALWVKTDVARREDVERLVRATLDRWGQVDVLVNNAGFGHYARVEDIDEADMRALLDVNFFGTLYGIQAVLPHMRARRTGHIVNVSSVAGRQGFPFHGGYAAAKHAVIGLTAALRGELAGSGVRASVVLPVGTATEFFDVARDPYGLEPAPMGIVQSAERVAKAIVRCVRRPVSEVYTVPGLKGALAIAVVAPVLADVVARRYYRRRTRGLDFASRSAPAD